MTASAWWRSFGPLPTCASLRRGGERRERASLDGVARRARGRGGARGRWRDVAPSFAVILNAVKDPTSSASVDEPERPRDHSLANERPVVAKEAGFRRRQSPWGARSEAARSRWRQEHAKDIAFLRVRTRAPARSKVAPSRWRQEHAKDIAFLRVRTRARARRGVASARRMRARARRGVASARRTRAPARRRRGVVMGTRASRTAAPVSRPGPGSGGRECRSKASPGTCWGSCTWCRGLPSRTRRTPL
jgi:hypothetical protein